MTTKQRKVILVEDSESISLLVKYKLTQQGFDVQIVADGELAFEIVKKELPEIVVLDLMLPIKDGLTVLREIKHDDLTKKIPVIMLTTNSEEDVVLKCFEAGAADYITKPFSTPVLIARINKILQ